MLDLYAVAQMKDAEERAEIEYEIPLSRLMENAGTCLAIHAMDMLGEKQRVIVFCGKGNNGGDGYVCGRHLLEKGYSVTLYGVYREALPSDSLAGHAASAFEKAGGKILPLTEESQLPGEKADLLVDALLGTGLVREISEPYTHAIDVINASGVPVLSCDLPSGVDADSGQVLGRAVYANRTLMLGLAKLTCRLYPGREHLGELMLADIGLPHELVSSYTPISL